MSQVIRVNIAGDGAFNDLVNKMDQVILLAGPFTIAALKKGMMSGAPRVALRFDLPDGRVVIQEIGLRSLLVAVATIHAELG
ncbi:hypothetical protein LCGC14_2739310 [marine sediment metagenome]|uniref:Uncharacterized protein n=1 Tax=marine sediment metagenome TaxID=412755 RepID=A0A0F9BDW8_9ZZZZ